MSKQRLENCGQIDRLFLTDFKTRANKGVGQFLFLPKKSMKLNFIALVFQGDKKAAASLESSRSAKSFVPLG